MKATELMIGDWVEVILNSEKHFAQVQMIDGYGDNATSNECVCDAIYYSIDELKPIQLTAEILEKNGFNQVINTCKIKTYHRKPINVIMFSTPEITILPEESFIIKNLKIQYVHEFQHILRLCGMNELADNFKI